MAITISLELNRDIEIPGDYDAVFDLLADVPRSTSHFPKLDDLEDMGNNTYRWKMQKIGVDKYTIQLVYACEYSDDKESGRVTWDPVKGEGNGVVRGSWTLTREGESVTRAVFTTSAELTLPLPGLLKLAVSPVVKHEFNRLVDTYMGNLKKAFQ